MSKKTTTDTAMKAPVNFGDLIASVAADTVAKKNAEREAKEAAQHLANCERLEAIRPLLTVLRQAKERFPRLPVYDVNDIGTPHFYTSRSSYVEVRYDPASKETRLQLCNGAGNPCEVLARSADVENLIPPLVELLAKIVVDSRF